MDKFHDTRDVEFRARAQGSPQRDEERRGRTVFLGNGVKPSDRERSQCGLGGGKRENKQAVPSRLGLQECGHSIGAACCKHSHVRRRCQPTPLASSIHLPTPADVTPATPDTPFQALVDRFVDPESTFADSRKMSQPQIVPESVDHLTFLPASYLGRFAHT